MPSSEFVLGRVLSFIDAEGEQITVRDKSSTFDTATQKQTDTFSDTATEAFVTGPRRNFLGNIQNEEADLVVYIKGDSLPFTVRKDDLITIRGSDYHVLDSKDFSIRGTVVLTSIPVKR